MLPSWSEDCFTPPGTAISPWQYLYGIIYLFCASKGLFKLLQYTSASSNILHFDTCYTFFSSEKDETRNNAKLELRCVCVRLPKAEACLGQMHSCCDQASENKWGKAQEHSINQPDNNVNYNVGQIWRISELVSSTIKFLATC